MKNIILIIGMLFITLTGCDTTDDPPPIITSTGDCNCVAMTVVVSSAPTNAYIRMADGAYGANNFFMHEIENTSDGYVYAGTTIKVETKISKKNWDVPPSLWSAGRAKTDGLDPFAPTAAEYFQYGVLPREGWTASGNAPALKDDGWYLARMVMGYSINNKFNVLSHCYQRIFQFKRGIYE
jgi:hypothetical protein